MLDVKCIYNGHLISIHESQITFSNRAFRYGDSIFESIRLVNGKIMLLNHHLHRLKLSMNLLSMKIPLEFNISTIENLIISLIKSNKVNKDARIRLTVFRNEGGYYVPEHNDISYLIEIEKIDAKGYILNQKGFKLDLFNDIKKPISKISNCKTGSALLYIMAGLTKTSLELDDCFIINENEHIIESINSNVFIVKNNVIYTPPLSDGCIDGVMRKNILALAELNKMLTIEKSITLEILFEADEVFLTNAIKGLQWVQSFKNAIYTNRVSLMFNKILNESIH